MAIKPIEILINAKDNASGVFNSLKGTVATVGAAIAAYFGINAFAGIVKGAADLEQGMSRVQAATGATADEMAALRKAAEDAGANTKYTATEAAAALENLAKAGLSSSEAVAALPAVLNLAAAGDIELATSAEFVTKAVMGMGLAFEDAGRVADVLALGANATNTSVTGLAQALSYAAPVAQSLGLSLESTVAIIGKFADAGIDASRAGTALNSILSQFSNPASKFREELAAAGITTNNFEEALAQLAAAGPRGSKAIIAVGQEAGPALRALLNQGIGALSDLTARLKDAEGSAAATAATMQNNLSGAFSGLSSAWDTVKNTLGTPVLPVLTQGVNELATAFRSAVADGTVGRFGESIATAFKNGLQFVREFVASIDFGAVLARMQQFADDVNVTLARVGEYATNAGNVVKTAYGVMSAGANVVLTAIYGLGVAFTETAALILKGAILINENLQKIAFGSAKDRIIRETEDMRIALAGLEGVSTEFGVKARQSLDDVAAGARLARDGFAGVTGAAKETAPVMAATSAALGEVARQLEATAEKNAKARAATEAKAKADADAALAVQQLKDEYQAFVEAGDLQRAAEAFVRLEAAQRATINSGADAAKAAQETAAQVDAAFQRLGVTSSAALKQQADAALRDYKTIKDAGTATAQDLQNAFEVAAQKAIAANNGIAPSWVQAEAAARGLRLESDAAGQTIVARMKEAADATTRVGQAASGAARQYGVMANAAASAAKAAQNSRYEIARTDDKFSIDKSEDAYQKDRAARLGGGVGGGDNSGYFAAIEKIKSGAITDEDRALIETFISVTDFNNRSIASMRKLSPGLVSYEAVRQQQEFDAYSQRAQQMLETMGAGSLGTGRTGANQGVGGVIVNLNYNGAAQGPVPTTPEGQANLERFMAALQNDKGRT